MNEQRKIAYLVVFVIAFVRSPNDLKVLVFFIYAGKFKKFKLKRSQNIKMKRNRMHDVLSGVL